MKCWVISFFDYELVYNYIFRYLCLLRFFSKFSYYPKVSIFVGFEYHWSTARKCLNCSLFKVIFLKFEDASSFTLLWIKAPIRHSSSIQDTCSMKFLNAVKMYLHMCSMLELKLQFQAKLKLGKIVKIFLSERCFLFRYWLDFLDKKGIFLKMLKIFINIF